MKSEQTTNPAIEEARKLAVKKRQERRKALQDTFIDRAKALWWCDFLVGRQHFSMYVTTSSASRTWSR